MIGPLLSIKHSLSSFDKWAFVSGVMLTAIMWTTAFFTVPYFPAGATIYLIIHYFYLRRITPALKPHPPANGFSGKVSRWAEKSDKLYYRWAFSSFMLFCFVASFVEIYR